MNQRFARPAQFALSLLFLLARPASAHSGSQLVVDDDRAQCPQAGFTHIQDAVNAASPGDSIRVCKGTYIEQVSINKSLDIDADSGAILLPTSMRQNSTSLFDASPLASAILVSNATHVSIDGLTVDGSNAGISGCAPQLFGISFQNASGELRHVAVRNFKLAADLNGCQSGTGMFVQSGGGSSSHVVIEQCSIHDFQKNGITADEAGTQVNIEDNVITGLGPISGVAQNGIQIGFGAGGSISRNSVTNNLWSPCTSLSSCEFVATNILVVQSDGVEVRDNTVSVNQVGIFIAGNSASVEGNQTSATSVFDGIHLEGDQNLVRHNQAFNGAESGIFLNGNNNVVELNTVSEAAIGILKATGSSGNLILSNRVFDSPIITQDPSGYTLASLIQPQR